MTEPSSPFAYQPPEGFVLAERGGAYTRLVGPIYRRCRADGVVERGIVLEEKHLNSRGLVHGGLVSTLLDGVMAENAWLALKGPVATAWLLVEFLSPARLGEWVVAAGIADRVSAERAHVGATMCGDQSRIIATARAEFVRA